MQPATECSEDYYWRNNPLHHLMKGMYQMTHTQTPQEFKKRKCFSNISLLHNSLEARSNYTWLQNTCQIFLNLTPNHENHLCAAYFEFSSPMSHVATQPVLMMKAVTKASKLDHYQQTKSWILKAQSQTSMSSSPSLPNWRKHKAGALPDPDLVRPVHYTNPHLIGSWFCVVLLLSDWDKLLVSATDTQLTWN